MSLARDTQPVVAVVLDPADVVAVAEHLKHVNIYNKPIWILGKSFPIIGAFMHSFKYIYFPFFQGPPRSSNHAE